MKKKLIGKRSIIDFDEDYISYTEISDIFRAINDSTGRYTPGIYLMPFSKDYLVDSVIALRLIVYWVKNRKKDPELLTKLNDYLLSESPNWCDYIDKPWEDIINDACPGVGYKNDNPSLDNWLGDVPEDLDELSFLTRYNNQDNPEISDKLISENIQLFKDENSL